MNIEVEEIVINTVNKSHKFNDVSFNIDEGDTVLIVFENELKRTIFPLCNVLNFSYIGKASE